MTGIRNVSKNPFPSTLTVQRGDTLSKIAKQNGTTVKKLLAENPQLKNPNHIRAGEKLKRPAPEGKVTCRPPNDGFEGKRAKGELKGEAKGKLVGAGAGLGAKAEKPDPFKWLKLVGTGGFGW